MTTNEMAQKGFNTGFTDADGNELHVGDYVRLCGDIGEIVFSCGALCWRESYEIQLDYDASWRFGDCSYHHFLHQHCAASNDDARPGTVLMNRANRIE